MKARFSKWVLLGVGSGALVVMGATMPDSSQPNSATAPVSGSDAPDKNLPSVTTAAGQVSEPDATSEVSDAPMPSGAVISTPALPSNIPATSPLAQVARMAQAGVDESVLMSCVSNSTGTFNLDADRIIYLRDIGMPNDVITAMIQRDQALQQQMTAAATEQTAQTTPVAETAAATPAEAQATEPAAPVTVNYFYDNLAPYGSWVYVTGYGRCWRPSVAAYNSGWQPYAYGGRWVYTDCGWYWQSDYSWGATFHYGRWFRDARFGWCWWPDTVWAPSWVTWRYSANYCGWAPLPPFTTCTAAGFFYRGNAVSVGFSFGLDAGCYTFVATRDFCNPHPYRYRVAAGQAPIIYNQTTVINNFNVHRDNHHRPVIANNGISPQSVETATHQPIRPMPVNQFTGNRDGRNFPKTRPVASNNNNGNSGNNFRPQNPPDNFQNPAGQNRNNNRPAPSSVTVIGAHSPLDRANNNPGRTSPYTVYQSPAPAAHNNPPASSSSQNVVTPRQRAFQQESPRLTTPATPQTPRTPAITPMPQQHPAAPTHTPAPSAPRNADQPRNNPSHAESTRPNVPQRQLAENQPRNFFANNSGNPGGGANRQSQADRNANRPGH